MLLLALVIGVLIVSVFAVGMISSERKLYHDTILSSSFTCDQSWLEIEAGGRIKLDRDRQIFTVQFEKPFVIDWKGDGTLKWPSGESINIEIKLLDSDKVETLFPFAGARGAEMATFRPDAGLGENRSFEKVLIRCQARTLIKTLYWTTYNLKDMK